MKRIFLCVIILMTSAVLASAQLVGILEDDARIVRGTMPNGLAYYLVPNSSVKGYADFAFVQRNGLAMEDSSSLGMTYAWPLPRRTISPTEPFSPLSTTWG